MAANIRGGLGPQGFRGPKGEIGPTGAQGSPGINGINGSTGYTGIQGPTGIKGDPGLQGKGFIVHKSGDDYPNPDDFNDENIGEFYLKKGGDLYCYIPGTTGFIGDQCDLPNFKYVGDVTDDSLLVGPTGPPGINGTPGLNGTKGDTGPTAADYQYTSISMTLPTGTTNKILNVVNTGTGPINITYNSTTILTLANPYTYASFMYNGSTWNNVTS